MANEKKQQAQLRDRLDTQASFWRKFVAVRRLLDRNRTERPERKISFPFVVVQPTDQPGTDMGVKMQSNLKKLKVTSNNSLTLYGDLEVVAEMSGGSGE